MKKRAIILFSAMLMTSCFELNQEDETADGLKAALNVGTDVAVKVLGVDNGFYGSTHKIGLPPEMERVSAIIMYLPGGQTLVDNTVLSMNRSAEDAVKGVGTIFANAIRNMTIRDAMDILLLGDNDAATQYLHRETYMELTELFAGIIDNSLNTVKVGGLSTVDIWASLTSQYNTVANNPVSGGILGLTPINPDLGVYVTQKALDALFYEIGEKEVEIRTKFGIGESPLIQRVFGQLKNPPANH
ncbi:hypothetical protein SAMD00024442_11_23 [Candidatus Symbiothrix dinenymphae]|nr:hypothetical protein SAMD00024442_11_23 [Candidatus Symbiothrix dinenymphae]